MIKIKINIVLFLVFNVFSNVAYSASSEYAICDAFKSGDSQNLLLKINSGDKYYDTKNLILGFNLEMAQTIKTIGNYRDPEIIKLTTKLKPNALRYPGGTPANYFDWQKEALDEKVIAKHANKHMRKLLKNQKRNNKGKLPSASLSSYADLVHEYNIKPFIVLNVFKSIEDIKFAIDKVKRHIEKPIYWELGNEVSNEGYQKWIKLKNNKSWSVDGYIERLKFTGNYIKTKYPEDKIGIVASEMAEMRNPDNVRTWFTENKREKWDALIFESADFFDAVIVHPYVYATNKIIDDVDVPCRDNTKSLFGIKHKAWIMSNVSNLSTLYLKRLDERFPNKEVWLTEFGIIDQSGKSKDQKLDKQTGFRVLSTAANYLSWLEGYPKITTWLTHGMFEGFDWAHTVYPDLSYTANGVAYSFVKEFLSNVDEISNGHLSKQIIFPGVDAYKNNDVTSITALFGRDRVSNNNSMILANVSNSKLTIELPWVASSVRNVSFGWNEIVKPARFKDINDFDSQSIKSNKIDIKPRSVVIITQKQALVLH